MSSDITPDLPEYEDDETFDPYKFLVPQPVDTAREIRPVSFPEDDDEGDFRPRPFAETTLPKVRRPDSAPAPVEAIVPTTPPTIPPVETPVTDPAPVLPKDSSDKEDLPF